MKYEKNLRFAWFIGHFVLAIDGVVPSYNLISEVAFDRGFKILFNKNLAALILKFAELNSFAKMSKSWLENRKGAAKN